MLFQLHVGFEDTLLALGFDTGCSEAVKTCDWMAQFPDSTKLVHMNLPGTHDTSTCEIYGKDMMRWR